MTTYVAHDESEFAPPAEVGEARALPPEDLHRQVHLEPGREGDRDPVRGHRDRDRTGRAGVLVADAPAARLPGPCRLHHPEHLPPVGQHARDDHGHLPAHGAVPGRVRQLPDPADGRGPRHGVPVREHGQLLALPAGGAAARRELLRARRGERRRLDPVPAAGHPGRHAGSAPGHHPAARLAGGLRHRLHHGRPELRGDRAAGPHARHDDDAPAADGLGHLHGHHPGVAGVSRPVRQRHHDDAGPDAGHQLLHARTRLEGAATEPTRAAIRCCSSTCSGSSATPRSTSWRCPPSASCPT